MNYYWIRVFEYKYEKDDWNKGVMLDEFYLKSENLTREDAKKEVIKKYSCYSGKLLFSKPRKKDGIYAIVMDSNEYYYNYFYKEIDTNCIFCHKKIKGKWRDFPKIEIENKEHYFCSYDCKYRLRSNLIFEGEFQEKEQVDERVAGYIYHMYNKINDKHYIGQTKYLPFFRWQEHIKDGSKGTITEIIFDVITEVRYKLGEDGQERLNNAEAWWIRKYIEEGYEVFNVTIPKLSLTDYKIAFDEMIAREHQLEIKGVD